MEMIAENRRISTNFPIDLCMACGRSGSTGQGGGKWRGEVLAVCWRTSQLFCRGHGARLVSCDCPIICAVYGQGLNGPDFFTGVRRDPFLELRLLSVSSIGTAAICNKCKSSRSAARLLYARGRAIERGEFRKMKSVQISPMKYKAARLAHAIASAAGTKTISIVGMVSSAIEILIRCRHWQSYCTLDPPACSRSRS